MAIVKIIRNDLIELFKRGSFEAIAHGCNCQNMMGAGIADQIRRKLPEAFEADTKFYKRMNNSGVRKACVEMAGNVSVGHTKHGQVFNLYTQVSPGKNADYQLLQKAAENLNKFCKQRNITSVGIPLIGAGIGGLDPVAALTIIGACTPDIDVTVVVWHQDKDMWQKLSVFRNFEFPRKFHGVAILTGRESVSVLVNKEKYWSSYALDLENARTLSFQGETVLSLSDMSPNYYLLVDTKQDYAKNIERIYSI